MTRLIKETSGCSAPRRLATFGVRGRRGRGVWWSKRDAGGTVSVVVPSLSATQVCLQRRGLGGHVRQLHHVPKPKMTRRPKRTRRTPLGIRDVTPGTRNPYGVRCQLIQSKVLRRDR
jgi:hypothetical protein